MILAALLAPPSIAQQSEASPATREARPPPSANEDGDIFGELDAAAESGPEEAPDEDDFDVAIDEADDADDADDEHRGIEEITVTATRRAESIQDVPISVSAISSRTILEAGMTQFGQIQQFVPNLQILPATDTRSTSIRIRGIGSTGTNAGIDPSVGVFIDGVYQGRAGMSVGDLLDIERIEVLRGPQGTLFGKNTAAGAMNITTKRPSYEPEVFAETIIGSYNQMEFRGSMSGPIVDEKLALRVAGFRVLRDGFDTNRFTGEDVNDNDKYGIRARMLWDVSDDFSMLVSGDFSEQDDNCCVSDIITYEGTSLLGTTFDRLQRISYKAPFFADNPLNRFLPDDQIPIETPLASADPTDRVVGANVDPRNLVNVMGLSLDNTWLPGGSEHTIRWLSAWRRYTSDSQFDGDFSEYDAVFSTTDVKHDQVSSEIIWTSPIWSSYQMQGGVYGFWSRMRTVDVLSVERFYMDRNFIMSFDRFGFSGIPGDEPIRNINDNTHEMLSLAAYAQGTYSFTPKWSFTGGLRITHERKKRDVFSTSTWETGAAPVGGEDINRSDDRQVTNPQGLAVLRYEPTDEVMIYASFSNGFKSGGFNQVRVNELPAEFDDEIALNYELGTKTTWFDRRLTANVTGFYTDYDDFQAQTFSGQSINVRNACCLYSTGFEAELIGQPHDSVLIGTNIGFNVADYVTFEKAEATVEYQREVAEEYLGDPALLQSNPVGTVCGGDPLRQLPDDQTEGLDCSADLSGRELDNAPRWTLSAYATYTLDIPNTEAQWFNRADWSFQSPFNLAQDLDPNLQQNGFHLLNLRTGFRASNGLWDITFWVNNVTDEQWFVSGFDVPVVSGFAAVLGPPRQWGGTLRIMF